MGKQPVRMKAVVYALSPFQQKVMPGLLKDLPGKISHKFSSSSMGATLLLGPLVGTYSIGCRDLRLANLFASFDRIFGGCSGTGSRYVQWYQEKEKIEHRY